MMLLQAVTVQALPPEPTTDPAHPLARELMSAYAQFHDLYRRGDLETMKQMALASGGSDEGTPLPDWLTRWLLKLSAYLMLDPREGRFAAADVAETGDVARLIYIQEEDQQHRFFAAILRKANGTWFLGRTVSRTNSSTVAAGLDELRSETDGDLCPPSAPDTGFVERVVTRHGSDGTGYRIDCRVDDAGEEGPDIRQNASEQPGL